MCFLAFALVALAATEARAAGEGWIGSGGAERLRVFVLDTRTEAGVALVDARDVDRVVAQTLSKYASSLEVFDVRSIGDALEQERLKDVLGCDDACLADITRAMHAQFLFRPELARTAAGETTLTLRVMDTRTTSWRVIDSESLASDAKARATGVAELVRRVIDRLIGGPAEMLATKGTGRLSVATMPLGAEVYVDGRSLGFAPVRESVVAAGAHRLSLALEGHATLTEDIVIQPERTLDLERRLSVLRGGLLVVSEPAGARCHLDGADTLQETPCRFDALAVGKHEVTLRREGYRVFTEIVAVAVDSTTRQQLVLEPLPVPTTINSTPGGASVYVDGDRRGATRLSLELAPGEHAVKLVLAGYEDHETSLVVQPARPELLDIALRVGLSETERHHGRVVAVSRWSATGVAVAALVAGVVLGLDARGLAESYKTSRAGSAEARDLRAQAQDRALAADIAFAGAGVGAVASGLLWLAWE